MKILDLFLNLIWPIDKKSIGVDYRPMSHRKIRCKSCFGTGTLITEHPCPDCANPSSYSNYEFEGKVLDKESGRLIHCTKCDGTGLWKRNRGECPFCDGNGEEFLDKIVPCGGCKIGGIDYMCGECSSKKFVTFKRRNMFGRDFVGTIADWD